MKYRGTGATTTAAALLPLIDGAISPRSSGGLRAAGVDVFHVVLDADATVLRGRIEGSAEARQWRLDHLAKYFAARDWLTEEADLVLDTSAMRPDEVAARVAAALPVPRVC